MARQKTNELIKTLSDKIVSAQKEIRVLDAIKWSPEIEADFFAHQCKELPKVDKHYYEQYNPLNFNPETKIADFYDIETEIKQQLGVLNPAAQIMMHMCQEYREVIHLLMSRGTEQFYPIAKSLYGSSYDAFYATGPTMNDLANLMNKHGPHLIAQVTTERDIKRYNASQTCEILNAKMRDYFTDHRNLMVAEISDTLVSDAAAGAEKIRIRHDAMFSDRDLRMLEVHEGWVHLGTTLNGNLQPTCTFLSKGTPSAIVTQEGLAVLMELFTLSTFPDRVERIISRINAIHMAEDGANFLEVFQHLCATGLPEKEAYHCTVRVFRGSTPTGKPFTKDLAYNKGFIMLYNFIRLAAKNRTLYQVPLLFVGKIRLEDINLITALYDEGVIKMPHYIPPPINDLAALSCWLCYSLFMSTLNLNKLEEDYAGLIR